MASSPDHPGRSEDAEQAWREPIASVPDEATPLLPAESREDYSADPQDVPLPMGQITLIVIARIVETVSFFVILP